MKNKFKKLKKIFYYNDLKILIFTIFSIVIIILSLIINFSNFSWYSWEENINTKITLLSATLTSSIILYWYLINFFEKRKQNSKNLIQKFNESFLIFINEIESKILIKKNEYKLLNDKINEMSNLNFLDNESELIKFEDSLSSLEKERNILEKELFNSKYIILEINKLKLKIHVNNMLISSGQKNKIEPNEFFDNLKTNTTIDIIFFDSLDKFNSKDRINIDLNKTLHLLDYIEIKNCNRFVFVNKNISKVSFKKTTFDLKNFYKGVIFKNCIFLETNINEIKNELNLKFENCEGIDEI